MPSTRVSAKPVSPIAVSIIKYKLLAASKPYAGAISSANSCIGEKPASVPFTAFVVVSLSKIFKNLSFVLARNSGVNLSLNACCIAFMLSPIFFKFSGRASALRNSGAGASIASIN